MRTILVILTAVLLSACDSRHPLLTLTVDGGYQYDQQGNYVCNTHVDCYNNQYGYNNTTTGYATDGNIQGLEGCQPSGYGGGPMDCVINGRHQWVNTNQIRVDNPQRVDHGGVRMDNGGQRQQINRRLGN